MNRLLAVYFIWLLVAQNSSKAQTDSSECKYKSEKGALAAICDGNADNPRDEFPTNLKPGIEGLYIRLSSIEEINDNTFKDLSSIKYLYLERNEGLKISPGAFKPLKKLLTLDLSYNNKADISNIHFPETLVNLYLNRMEKGRITTKLPISSLVELKILTLRNNELDQIPSFEGHLPSLQKLDVSKNKLKNFKLDSLADLCNLKVLDISSDTSIQDNCECLRLKKYIKDHGITGSNLTCKTSENNEACNTSPSANFNQTYESCQAKARTTKLIHHILFGLLIGGIIFGVCISCVIMYVCCNRKDFSDDTIRAYCCLKKKQKMEEMI